MDSRYLRAFLAVAENGGISAAAEHLGYAQSSVSDQLRSLERELGVRVLCRKSNGTSLTPAGSRLLPYARKMVDLEAQLRQAAGSERPTIRVGALEALVSDWLPELLTALSTLPSASEEASLVRSPAAPSLADGVEWNLSIGTHSALATQLESGQLDVVFSVSNAKSPAPAPSTVIAHDRAILVASPDHPLARKDAITVADLQAASFIVKDRNCYCGWLFDQFSRDFTPNLQVDMVTGSSLALRRMVGHGRGIALLPSFSVTQDIADGDLVPLHLEQSPDIPPEALLTLADLNIMARWRTGLDKAELPLHALLRLAKRNPPPLPDLSDYPAPQTPVIAPPAARTTIVRPPAVRSA